MSLIQTLRTIKSIVDHIQWDSAVRAPQWFLSMHVPYIFTCLITSPFRYGYKNLLYNSKVYDGMTRNDFIRGNFIRFLFEFKVIQQPESYVKDEDGRGYFIGYKDDDND